MKSGKPIGDTNTELKGITMADVGLFFTWCFAVVELGKVGILIDGCCRP